MKRFTVIYDASVEKDLAQLVVEHFDAPAARDIARASDRIDKVLSMSPSDCGQSIRDNLRVLWVPPLEIMHVVLNDDCQVLVIDVRLAPEQG